MGSIARALANPVHSYRKVKQYGFGRVVLDQFENYPTLHWHVREPIRAAKIAVDPVGYARRRRLARELAASSPYRDYFPENKAYRVAPPGTFEAIDKIIPTAQKQFRQFLDLFPNGQMDGSAYSYILCDLKHARLDPRARETDLALHPEFQALAQYRPFVEIASTYLGEVPVIGGVDLQVVMPNTTTVGFQKFHIDRIASRQLKIFIAVEDVDEGNGATVIVPADASDTIARALNHRFGRIADERILSDEWRHHVERAAGPAGTAFFFDTCRTIHCGARTRTRPRVLIMLQYVSKYSYAETDAQRGLMKVDKSRIGDDPVDRLLFDLD